MAKYHLTVVFLLPLAGCAGAGQLAQGPSWPTPAQIGSDIQVISTVPASPVEYEFTGFKQVRSACVVWFNNLVTGSQGSSLLQTLLGLGAGGAAAAGGPAGVAAGLGLASAGIGAIQSSLGAGVNPAAAYTLIDRMMDTWEAAETQLPPPATLAEADSRVQALWKQCTIANVVAAQQQAAANVQLTATIPTPPPTPIFQSPSFLQPNSWSSSPSPPPTAGAPRRRSQNRGAAPAFAPRQYQAAPETAPWTEGPMLRQYRAAMPHIHIGP
jgi:hypothetical protein